MNLADVYTQDTDNTFTKIAMDDQTVLEIPTPPQQSVAQVPLAGQRRKRPKVTADPNHDDSTKQIVAVLVGILCSCMSTISA